MTNHGGYFSYLLATATQAEYYTTVSENETISFTDGSAARSVNSLMIENCAETVVYVQPLPGNYIYPVYKNDPYTIDGVTLRGFKVFGAAGQKVRYSGCFV